MKDIINGENNKLKCQKNLDEFINDANAYHFTQNIDLGKIIEYSRPFPKFLDIEMQELCVELKAIRICLSYETTDWVKELTRKLSMSVPSEKREIMQRIDTEVPILIRNYVRDSLLGKPYEIFKKNAKWLSLSDLGVEIFEPECKDYSKWIESWKEEADKYRTGKYGAGKEDADKHKESKPEIGTDESEQNDMGISGAQHCNIYETHAHIDLKVFDPVRDELMDIIKDVGISHIIVPSINKASWIRIQETCGKFVEPKIFYVLGLHPKYLNFPENEMTDRDWKEFGKFIKENSVLKNPNGKIVAVGEVGLDYTVGDLEIAVKKQKEYLIRFIDAANEAGLPMIFHFRPQVADRTDIIANDVVAILKEHKPKNGAVVHCFTGTPEDVNSYLQNEIGITHFGIGGKLLQSNCMNNNGSENECKGDRKNAGESERGGNDFKALEAAVKIMPQNAILLETDAPYVKSNDSIGNREPNTSLTLFKVAKRIGEIRGEMTDKVLRYTYENAKRLFGTD